MIVVLLVVFVACGVAGLFIIAWFSAMMMSVFGPLASLTRQFPPVQPNGGVRGVSRFDVVSNDPNHRFGPFRLQPVRMSHIGWHDDGDYLHLSTYWFVPRWRPRLSIPWHAFSDVEDRFRDSYARLDDMQLDLCMSPRVFSREVVRRHALLSQLEPELSTAPSPSP